MSYLRSLEPIKTVMLRIIPILILILDIIVLFDIIRSYKDEEKKILWVIAVLFLPVFGPILWYFFGKNR
jgi:hypothetical protein